MEGGSRALTLSPAVEAEEGGEEEGDGRTKKRVEPESPLAARALHSGNAKEPPLHQNTQRHDQEFLNESATDKP